MRIVFALGIEIGNDAMSNPEDVAEALRRVAENLDDNPDRFRSGSFGHQDTILDTNGNSVGWFSLQVAS